MKKFFESQKRFNTIDGENFGMCYDQISNNDKLVEWRIRKVDNQICIIQYYENGAGYEIYVPENVA